MATFFYTAFLCILIHSAYPQSRPIVIIVFAHVVRPYSYVHTFQNLAKQKQISSENNAHYWRVVGPAEWIIDDTCLVSYMSGEKG